MRSNARAFNNVFDTGSSQKAGPTRRNERSALALLSLSISSSRLPGYVLLEALSAVVEVTRFGMTSRRITGSTSGACPAS